MYKFLPFGHEYREHQPRKGPAGALEAVEFSPVALAPSFATLLQYASLRGVYALLDSSIPSLLRAMRCDRQRG